MSEYHIAQLNIAKMKFSFESPQMLSFIQRLEEINLLADDSPGFIWRLETEEGDATAINYFGEDVLVNMSVWEDIDSLHQYVYRSAHIEVLSNRQEWFDRVEEAYSVLWWVHAGQIPSIEEAASRLDLLRHSGPGPEAFTFKQRFDPV